MSKISEISKKTEAELFEAVKTAKETLRTERFKDKFSRKASVINGAKREVARALTELTARRNKEVK